MFNLLLQGRRFSQYLEPCLMLFPVMGLNKILESTLAALCDDNSLRSWTIFHDKNGSITMRIKFECDGGEVERDEITYKRKAPSQVARDRRRGEQWKCRDTNHPGSSRRDVVNEQPTVTQTSDFTRITRSKARTNSGGDIEMMRHGRTREGVCDIMNISELVTSTPPGLDPCASPFISLNEFTVTSPHPRDSCSSTDVGSSRDTCMDNDVSLVTQVTMHHGDNVIRAMETSCDDVTTVIKVPSLEPNTAHEDNDDDTTSISTSSSDTFSLTDVCKSLYCNPCKSTKCHHVLENFAGCSSCPEHK